MDLDDNLRLKSNGAVVCAHCETELGRAQSGPLANAIHRERPSTDAGPGVHASPDLFTDRPIGLRQAFCPNCYAVLATEIVPTDEPEYRNWTLQSHSA